MPTPPSPELLRSLGWVMDLHGARHVEVASQGAGLAASWQNPAGAVQAVVYDETDLVQISAHLREMRAYDSVEPLIAQIGQDVADTRAVLAG